MWFNGSSAEFNVSEIPMEDGKSWILANIGQQGVYRVNYTEQNWKAVIKQLKANHTVISSVNRAQLINDAWSFSRANQLNTDIALGTVDYLSKEMDYITRYAANRQLDFLDNMLSQSIYYGKFKMLMRKFVKDAYRQYGLNSTNLNHIESYMRTEISNKACNYDLPECVSEAKRQYKDWINSPDLNRINPSVRYTVYCTAIRTGDEIEWDFAYRQYKQATVASEINNLLNALACTEVPWLLQRFLQYSLTPSEIRKQETGSVLVNVASNPVGRNIARDFVLFRWDYIHDDYLAGYWNGGGVIKELSKVINTEYQLQQLFEFGSSISDLHRADRDYHQAIETSQSNIKWAKTSMDLVEKWLDTMAA